ncbi:MAG: 4-hydroxythreonine-4-phosphate dehydrogenase PdxA, partial [Ignavibacteria bacterium]
MVQKKPKLLFTIGDPNGVGPEIILKIFQDLNSNDKYNLKITGAKTILDSYSSLLNLPEISRQKIIEIPLPKKFKLTPGKIDKAAGKISGDAIKLATELCMKKEFDALITMPVSKEALNVGGYDYPGHTEMLTKLTKSNDTVMILYSEEFSVGLITGHIPLKEVSKQLNKKLIFSKTITVNNSLVKDFKIIKPKIALLSLNPHAGDGGLIGNEEIKFIKPVIEEMNSMGFNVRGPFSSDAYFANKSYKKFDMTIAMYHDQGLIPFKMISFGRGVNFTAG